MPQQFIEFGEWLPDIQSFAKPGLRRADNVIPDAYSYRPMPGLSAFSTNALGGRCQGAGIGQDAGGTTYNFAGDVSALYVTTTSSFTAVTRVAGSGGAYVTPSGAFWEFAQWGQTMLAVNGISGDFVQKISLGAANFVNLTGAPKASSLSIVRDFVVIGGVSDSATQSQRVRWSAINNSDSWTPDAATLADFQDLPGDGGPVQKVVGGEYGVIFQRRSIFRQTFVGSPLVFQFDNVQRNIGAFVPQGVVSYQNLAFFLAEDGFYVFDGINVTPIGRGKVDRTFFSEVDTANINRTMAMIDPANKLVLWASPTTGNASGNPNTVYMFNWAYNKWARITGLNIQTINQQISSGPVVTLAAFDSTNKLQRFNGSNMSATIRLAEYQFSEGRRSMITEVRPLIEASDDVPVTAQAVTVDILTGENSNVLMRSHSVAASAALNNTGFAPVRASGRYHVIRARISASSTFSHFYGMEVTYEDEGTR